MLKLTTTTLLALLALASASETTTDGTTTDGTTTTTTDELQPGETKCTCALPGGSGKCDKGSGTARWQVCSWLQECHTSSNISYSMCISKGNKVCNRHVHLGTSGSIVAVKEHHPSKICCDDQACTSRQACIDQEGGSPTTFEYEYANSNGGTTTMMSWTLADVAHNGWKTKEGTAFKNKPKVCVDQVFDATQAGKQVIAPGLAMIFAILFVCLGCCNRNVSKCGMVLPTFIIVMSFFLTLSEGMCFAMFTMGVAAASIATPAEHKGKLIILQVTYCWLLFGGTNWFFATGTIKNFFTVAGGGISAVAGKSDKMLIEVETSCKLYFYDYYKLEEVQKNFKTDSTKTTWGLCERDWLQFLVGVAYVQAFAFFLMVALTLLEYLSPTHAGERGAGPKGFFKQFKREKASVSPTGNNGYSKASPAATVA